GIMNIMLVSVTERTREIGVRKALGATPNNILFQFLVEALVLCLVGGILGIVFGSLGAVLLSKVAGWNTLISPLSVILSFFFSALVGLFFGIWPARRAAGRRGHRLLRVPAGGLAPRRRLDPGARLVRAGRDLLRRARFRGARHRGTRDARRPRQHRPRRPHPHPARYVPRPPPRPALRREPAPRPTGS